MAVNTKKWVVCRLSDYSDEEINEMISSSPYCRRDQLNTSKDGNNVIFKWMGSTPDIFDGISTLDLSGVKNKILSTSWITKKGK